MVRTLLLHYRAIYVNDGENVVFCELIFNFSGSLSESLSQGLIGLFWLEEDKGCVLVMKDIVDGFDVKADHIRPVMLADPRGQMFSHLSAGWLGERSQDLHCSCLNLHPLHTVVVLLSHRVRLWSSASAICWKSVPCS